MTGDQFTVSRVEGVAEPASPNEALIAAAARYRGESVDG